MELADVDLARDARFLEERAELLAVPVLKLLLDAIGAQALHFPAHEEPSLVDGIAERLAGIA